MKLPFLLAGFLLASTVSAMAQPIPCNCKPGGANVMPGDQTDKIFSDRTTLDVSARPAFARPSTSLQRILSVRNGTGEVETHADWIDHFFIVSGEADLTLGGTVVNDKETAPGERRGESVTGGTTYHLTPHTIVDIPAGMPHLIVVPKGGHLTYLAFKEKN